MLQLLLQMEILPKIQLYLQLYLMDQHILYFQLQLRLVSLAMDFQVQI